MSAEENRIKIKNSAESETLAQKLIRTSNEHVSSAFIGREGIVINDKDIAQSVENLLNADESEVEKFLDLWGLLEFKKSILGVIEKTGQPETPEEQKERRVAAKKVLIEFVAREEIKRQINLKDEDMKKGFRQLISHFSRMPEMLSQIKTDLENSQIVHSPKEYFDTLEGKKKRLEGKYTVLMVEAIMRRIINQSAEKNLQSFIDEEDYKEKLDGFRYHEQDLFYEVGMAAIFDTNDKYRAPYGKLIAQKYHGNEGLLERPIPESVIGDLAQVASPNMKKFIEKVYEKAKKKKIEDPEQIQVLANGMIGEFMEEQRKWYRKEIKKRKNGKDVSGLSSLQRRQKAFGYEYRFFSSNAKALFSVLPKTKNETIKLFREISTERISQMLLRSGEFKNNPRLAIGYWKFVNAFFVTLKTDNQINLKIASPQSETSLKTFLHSMKQNVSDAELQNLTNPKSSTIVPETKNRKSCEIVEVISGHKTFASQNKKTRRNIMKEKEDDPSDLARNWIVVKSKKDFKPATNF